jgi:hypothetical protein
MHDSQATLKSHVASLSNLEEQIGQIAMQMSQGPNGMFTSEVIMSPMEQCHSVTTNEAYNEGGVDGFPPKVNEDIEGQVIKECKIF